MALFHYRYILTFGLIIFVVCVFWIGNERIIQNKTSTPQGAEIFSTKKGIKGRSIVKEFGETPNGLISWQPPKLPDHLQNVDQTDPELIAHIRDHWIIPPFKGPIVLKNPTIPQPGKDRSEQTQPTVVDNLQNNRNEGFYVECGAADGELNSNSLLFELYRHWDGILIEANPIYFSEILKKKRRVFMLNACLSPTRTPQIMNFTVDGIGGGISDLIPLKQQLKRKSKTKSHVVTQCFPLYSILQALNVYHVHYFSLDIEGPELNVLKTIPLNDTIIDIITIETRVVDDHPATKKKVRDCADMLKPYGYRLVKNLLLDIVMSRLPK